MSSPYGEYQADPRRLRQAASAMNDLVEQARAMGDNFRSNQDLYLGWNGWSDDYFQKTNPDYMKANEQCLEVAGAFADAVAGLVHATLETAGSIEGNQSDVTDMINDHAAATEDMGGDDTTTGGGRH